MRPMPGVSVVLMLPTRFSTLKWDPTSWRLTQFGKVSSPLDTRAPIVWSVRIVEVLIFSWIMTTPYCIATMLLTSYYWYRVHHHLRRMQPTFILMERILDHRRRRNKMQYLVKWRNFDDTNNTWEPEDHFFDPASITIYWSARTAS